MDLTINLPSAHSRSLTLTSPLMIAARTFGQDGYSIGTDPEALLASLRAVLPKTFTRRPRAGNRVLVQLEMWYQEFR